MNTYNFLLLALLLQCCMAYHYNYVPHYRSRHPARIYRQSRRFSSYWDRPSPQSQSQSLNEDYDMLDGGQCAAGGGKSGKQKSAYIAQQAAKDANSAKEAQAGAGLEASHQVKELLAEKAYQAAKAADAVLSCKQEMLKQLEKQLQDAQTDVQNLSGSLQAAQDTVEITLKAAKEAHEQLGKLTDAVNQQKIDVAKAADVAIGEQQLLGEHTALLDSLNKRVELLRRQLGAAKADYAVTEQAYKKAGAYAHEAVENVSKN